MEFLILVFMLLLLCRMHILAIRHVSPQAPVTDEFIGDDCNHNGAFFLLDNFDFYNYFDGERNAVGDDYKPVFESEPDDLYKFFLDMGYIEKC